MIQSTEERATEGRSSVPPELIEELLEGYSFDDIPLYGLRSSRE